MTNDCPGRHKCHGPASWCNKCGDVDLVCDDPRCETHARCHERLARLRKAIANVERLKAQLNYAAKELDEAERAWTRYCKGNVVMVPRAES